MFERAFKVVERTSNILKGAKEAISEFPDPSLFQEQLERQLHSLYEESAPELKRLIKEEKFDETLSLYGNTFFKPLHVFFDKVLVNVEDRAIRKNRHALMKEINRIFVDSVADLSLMTHMEIKT